MKKRAFVIFLLMTFSVIGFSQKRGNSLSKNVVIYTDYKPQYRNWKDNYILDKIEYTKTEVIFNFHYVSYLEKGKVNLYGRATPKAWFLMSASNEKKRFRHSRITEIRKNDVLILQEIQSEKVSFPSQKGDTFSCKIHFRKLPSSLKKVHLIEGIGKAEDPNYFNCFDIEMKSSKSDLGNKEDMKEEIIKFETKKDAIFAKEFLELINKMRSEGCKCGTVRYRPAPPVIWNNQVARASKNVVYELWEKNSMSSSQDGKTTKQRLAETGYKTKRADENMSYGYRNIQRAFDGWKKSPAQCSRMMNRKVKEIGAAKKGKYWDLILPFE